MSKKSTQTPRTQTVRTRTRTGKPAPLGLRAIFSALQSPAYHNFYGPAFAENYVDVPHAILKAQDQDKNTFVKQLFAAAEREYPHGEFGDEADRTASQEPEIVAIASFWAGVATAWHVMTAINGKDGAR